MTWIMPSRNYDGVQHEKLRREIDKEFTDFHDALSKAYYDGMVIQSTKIVEYGYVPARIDFGALKKSNPALAKEMFDILHGINEEARVVKFHEVNILKSAKEQIPQEEYNPVDEATGKTQHEIRLEKIAEIKNVLVNKQVV